MKCMIDECTQDATYFYEYEIGPTDALTAVCAEHMKRNRKWYSDELRGRKFIFKYECEAKLVEARL